MKSGIARIFFALALGSGATALSPPPFFLLSQTAPAVRFFAVMKGVGALPVPIAISRKVRPDATDVSFSSRMASSLPSFETSSRCLISSQLVRLPPPPLRSHFMRTSTQLPDSRSPTRVNLRSPRFRPSCGSPSGIQ